jgi:hypothetical protein
MSPEKSKILTERYPRIFNPKGSVGEPFNYYGFECEDGWFDLIDVLCRKIQNHVDHKITRISDEEERENLQLIAVQVKQKYSTLRFYYSGGDEYTSGLVDMTESISGTICETCGDKATVRTSGWMRNLCNSCHIRGKFKEKGFELK